MKRETKERPEENTLKIYLKRICTQKNLSHTIRKQTTQFKKSTKFERPTVKKKALMHTSVHTVTYRNFLHICSKTFAFDSKRLKHIICLFTLDFIFIVHI